MGVYKSAQKARDEGESQPLPKGSFWSIVPVEIDSDLAFPEDIMFFDDEGDSLLADPEETRRWKFPARIASARLWLSLAGIVVGVAASFVGVGAFGETPWGLSLLGISVGLILFICSTFSLVRLTLERRLYIDLLSDPSLASDPGAAWANRVERRPAQAVAFTLMLGCVDSCSSATPSPVCSRRSRLSHLLCSQSC
jgi:hypothetical protein